MKATHNLRIFKAIFWSNLPYELEEDVNTIATIKHRIIVMNEW